MSSPIRLSRAAARAAVLACQGLSETLAADPVGVLEETGLVRTLGGVDVYLAVAARLPGMGRADLEAAVARGDARILPAARGCMYLVPRRDAAVALRLADRLSARRAEREHEKAGIRPGEVEALAAAVVAALRERGPSTPQALRQALPEGLARPLGEAGKKVGISSPLPPALRRLEFAGAIERAPEEGRLDSERYLWRVPETSLFALDDAPDDPAEVDARVAEVYFRAAGLGDRDGFADWSGLGKHSAAAAMARLDLVPFAVEGYGERLALAARRELVASPPSPAAAVAFLPFADNAVTLHGPAFLADAGYHAIQVPAWGREAPTTLGEARHATLRAIVAGGRLAGFWELDPDAGRVVTGVFASSPADLRRRVEERAEDVRRLLVDELGNGHSFSLDTDDDLRRRARLVAALDAQA